MATMTAAHAASAACGTHRRSMHEKEAWQRHCDESENESKTHMLACPNGKCMRSRMRTSKSRTQKYHHCSITLLNMNGTTCKTMSTKKV